MAAGLLVATLAINVPHCILTYALGRAVARLGDAAWLRATKRGLVPATVGLILASGVVMGRAADHGVPSVVISAGTAMFIVLTDRNPLWMLAAGTLVSLVVAHIGMPQ